jgi:HlyD family secretion protein
MTATVKSFRVSPWWGLLLIPIALFGLVSSGVIKPPRPPGAPAETVSKIELVEVQLTNFRIAVTGPGTLEASNSLDVKPSISGTILELPKVGMRVAKGTLIAKLDPEGFNRTLENAQLSLQKAKAQLGSTRASQRNNRGTQQQTLSSSQSQVQNAERTLQSAQTNLRNAQSLYEVGGGTMQAVRDAQKAVDDANSNVGSARVALQTAQNAIPLKADSDTQDLYNLELAVRQAEISVKNAQTDLQKTKIYAPKNGIVSSVPAQIGSSVSSQNPLFTLLEDQTVHLPVQVDETEIGKVKIGQNASISLDAIKGETFVGTVTRIAPQARVVSNIAIFDVTVSIPNTNLQLRPGMSAEAEIIAQELSNVLIIPSRAIETMQNNKYINIATPNPNAKLDPTITRTRIETGASDNTQTVVLSGLSAGQQIVMPSKGKKAAPASNGLLPPTN